VTTCEQCGADTVDSQGICRNCGWQAQDPESLEDGAPSLGETRAAGVIDDGAGAPGARPTPRPRFERTTQLPPYGTPGQPASPSKPPVLGTSTSIARYCGACGARISGSEAFCGQCGTPVGAPPGSYGGPAPRYHVGGTGNWTPEQGEAPTEAYIPSPGAGYAGSRPGAPYYPVSQPGARQGNGGRTARIVIGVLCLMGSVGSAIAAVILAVAK
jgi:hypothetical protein